jgi:REP element-mobilizing transposase RayT
VIIIKILKSRKKQRLKDYNYSCSWYYFITICTYNRVYKLGYITSGKVALNDFGKEVNYALQNISKVNQNIKIDEYIIMPNHIHAIFVLDNSILNNSISIPEVIRRFKIYTTKIYKKYYTDLLWQKSYYDRIIRNEKEYIKIKKYIEENPLKWEIDQYYKQN